MTKQEKQTIIALLRSEILLQRQLSIIKAALGSYYHSNDYNEADLLACEKEAQDLELD